MKAIINITDRISLSVTQTTEGRKSLGSTKRMSMRSFASLWMTMLVAMTFFAACTAEESLAPQTRQPITVSAAMPGEVWATASRASSMGTLDKTDYSEVELHYTDYKGEAATHKVPLNTIEFSVANSAYSFWFTTGSDLVWEKVDATKPIHLTCKEGDVTFHTSVESAVSGEALTFTDAMKPTMAKLTVKLTFNHNITGELQTLNATVTAKGAATDYHPQTDGGIHQTDETAAVQSLALAATGSDNVFTSSMLLPEQTMGNMLTVTYGSDITWTLDLSQVKVKDTNPVQYANQLIAGQHLTLNLKASVTNLNTPADVQIEAFTKADAAGYESELGGVAKTYTYDAGTKTYTILHEAGIEACLVDRAKNNPTAEVVSKIPALAVVSGAETDLEAVKAAIDGKTVVLVTGTELKEYYEGNNAQTLLGEAIYQLTGSDKESPKAGTITLLMPDVIILPKLAFYSCNALKSISAQSVTTIEEYAVECCYALTSVSFPAATLIGKGAFYSCASLSSVSFSVAKSIGDIAFMCCASLSSASFPAAITIGEYAFQDCAALTSVSLPAVTTIGKWVFYQCISLSSASFPVVTSIGDRAFLNCEKLKELSFGSVITDVNFDAFINVGSKVEGGCALTLASGQEHIGNDNLPNGTAVVAAASTAEASARIWTNNTWKSITIK